MKEECEQEQEGKQQEEGECEQEGEQEGELLHHTIIQTLGFDKPWNVVLAGFKIIDHHTAGGGCMDHLDFVFVDLHHQRNVSDAGGIDVAAFEEHEVART